MASVASLHQDGWVYGAFMCLFVAECYGGAEQMCCADADVPEFLVCVAQTDVEVEGVAFDVVLCEGRVAAVVEVKVGTVESYHK